MASGNGSVDRIYAERSARFAAERDRCAQRSRRISILRLLAFVAAVMPILWPLSADGGLGFPGRGAISTVFLLLFLGLIFYHQKVRQLCDWYDRVSKLNEEGRRRLARDWDALPSDDAVEADSEHPFADDLDLFGPASLSSLLSTAGTPGGGARLKAWLLEPAAADQVEERQTAVAELAPMLDLREELTVRGRLMSQASPAGLEDFFRWAEGGPWLAHRTWLLSIARTAPIAAIALIALTIAGIIDYTAAAAVLILNLGLTYTVCREIPRIFDRAFAREAAYQQYAAIFRLISESTFESRLLEQLQAELNGDGIAADRQVSRLGRLLQLAEVRHSMAYVPLQAITLWDIHVLGRLERWQRRVGHHVRRWFAASDEMEALAALAGLKHDNPGWIFPEITEAASTVLEAKHLGHPLIADAVRVPNDVEIGPPGSFLMVTGSNMSGKSTLLRAIGTNAVLALAGGPVCASAMRLPPLRVATSMRVHDSLQQGLSHFMAELQRLKWVVDLARAAGDGRMLLYLLDDILQGTNSVERQVAARSIIGALQAEPVIGAVTTHDLTLADTPELADAARSVHFSETIGEGPDGPLISFDYKLHPGIATSSNALKLVELVGLSTKKQE